METVSRAYKATNENSVATFETILTASGVEIVLEASPVIRKLILGRTVGSAVRHLTDRGWDVEIIE